ncbi:PepSY domain-containing protein [Helicobacter ailurogastricus]|uniref:PepSY domain-containing protein n=1 Tax=Helicobacter ailurogastricus TaxID=1578720 RepID=UPI000CF1A02C|nr:PepSY domain-containing protein [Helicobacter ailurogastricus]
MPLSNIYKFHAYTSVFFLPFALLFALSGAAFLLGFNANSGAKIRKWHVEKSSKTDLDFLLDFLKTHNIPQPSKLAPRKRRGDLIIGTPAYEIEFDPKQSVVSVIQRSFLGVLMQVHKGRAGVVLKAFGVVFGVFSCFFYISGLLMGFKRKNTASILSAFLLGTAVLGGFLALAL